MKVHKIRPPQVKQNLTRQLWCNAEPITYYRAILDFNVTKQMTMIRVNILGI